MADISKILGGSIKEKILGVTSAKGFSKEGSSSLTKVIAKNFMALPGIARDLNVARQNIQTLVELEGGKPASSPDAFFLKEKEREKKLEVETAERRPKKTAGKALAKGLIMMGLAKLLKIVFASFSKVLLKYLAPAVILGVIFVQFKDAFVEWATSLFDAIKTKFDEFTSELGQWFTDSVATVGDKIKDFVKPIIDTVSGFFSKVGDFFVGYFEIWRNVITSPILTVKKVYDSFMSGIDKLKSGVDKVKNFLGFGKKEAPVKEAPVDDTAERQRLLRQQKEAQETERIRKLEKEKQYTGEDEIVRRRMGLPEKTETMRREAEMAKAPPPVEPAPPPAPIIVPSPIPPVKKEEAKPKAKAPVQAVAPKVEPKPSPTEAEKPKAAVGSLTSVATVQPGVDLSFSPELEKRVTAMAADFKEKTGKKLIITSGFRSNEKQKQLYDDWKAGKLKAPAVARPMPPLGTGQGSAHMFGTAIDIAAGGPKRAPADRDMNRLAGSISNSTGWLESFGLTRPVKSEDWHVQLPKAPPIADNPFSPGSPIPVPTKDGKAVDVASGKKETVLSSPPAPKSSGSQVAASSAEIAAGQRQQMKPQTPVVVNAPTTNNQVVKKTQVASSKRNDVGSSLANAAA